MIYVFGDVMWIIVHGKQVDMLYHLIDMIEAKPASMQTT